MTGTIVNAVAVVLGALIGLIARKGIPQQILEAIVKVEGIAIILIGLCGVLEAMLTVDLDTGRISSQGSLLLLVSLVAGCLAGELLRIDDRLTALGRMAEQRIGSQDFARGVTTATLIFCIGAMSIVGAMNDGLRGDSSVLFVKSALDFTTSIVLASTLGVGVAFSAVPLFLFQGGVSLLAGFLTGFVTDGLLALFCMVGYTIVTLIGFNFLCDTKIKTANLLPSLLVPVLYYLARY